MPEKKIECIGPVQRVALTSVPVTKDFGGKLVIIKVLIGKVALTFDGTQPAVGGSASLELAAGESLSFRNRQHRAVSDSAGAQVNYITFLD